MTETTQEERDEWLDDPSPQTEDVNSLIRDANLAAAYERQCISRTADMPEWAAFWRKSGQNIGEYVVSAKCIWEGFGGQWERAPDLLPDESGPVYRHIVDVE